MKVVNKKVSDHATDTSTGPIHSEQERTSVIQSYSSKKFSVVSTRTKFGNLDSQMKMVNKKVTDHATDASTGHL